MKHWLIALYFVVMLTGCGYRIHPEFYDVVHSHRELTIETIDAVSVSIKGELEERTDLTIEQVVIIQDLLARLDFIKNQAIVMDRYIQATAVDQELLRELLRQRWNNPTGNPELEDQ